MQTPNKITMKQTYGRSKEAPQKSIKGLMSRMPKADLQKAQTYMRGATHPFNPNYIGKGGSQFVSPKGANKTILAKYGRTK